MNELQAKIKRQQQLEQVVLNMNPMSARVQDMNRLPNTVDVI